MMKQALSGEFRHEAENTRKLLSMIPDSPLDHRRRPHLAGGAGLFVQPLIASRW
ncbi:hypothetical protein [Chitinophaga parva]|uniref:hypothetical protein n=1 Tax=Chitinophaga parva TaxID=2169414 RepID=UPI00196B1665|nr:hypothetical protein [Chitinophaga parva]